MLLHRYEFSVLDPIEDIELYRPGGLHPVLIVLHKLGYGGSSTVWLARDQGPQGQSLPISGTLVALKVISAIESSGHEDEVAELAIPFKLDAFISATQNAARDNIQVINDHFIEEGPNGTHLCIVYRFAGPSLRSMSSAPFRMAGSRRLRGDLARKVAKQTASAVELMHSAGVVHGDLTSGNILFQVSDQARRWSDNEIRLTLGEPITDKVETIDLSPPMPHAPPELIEPVKDARLSSPTFLEENIIVIDFGQSFDINRLPKDYKPATAMHYFSPEATLEDRVSTASDIWGLACTIFEIRAGFSLFGSFFAHHPSVVLVNIVLTLGKLPEPWWSAFEGRHEWFEENGEPKPPGKKSTIQEKLRMIGAKDTPPDADEGPMIEPVGTRLEEGELVLLGDLLEKMLKYRPEERITIREVVHHPWFKHTTGH
ncbi:kinase-like domain-containing protein [Amanita rubescens]|nr:kinase-like domain-containing protein [Amanita rubescens]